MKPGDIKCLGLEVDLFRAEPLLDRRRWNIVWTVFPECAVRFADLFILRWVARFGKNVADTVAVAEKVEIALQDIEQANLIWIEPVAMAVAPRNPVKTDRYAHEWMAAREG